MAYQKVDQSLELNQTAEESVDSSIQLEESNKLGSRISYLRSRLGLSVSPQIVSKAIDQYSQISKKNRNLSHFRILAKMQQNQRDALTQVSSAVPLPALVNASDSQFQRIVKDVVREENEMLNEETSPPAVLLLKRQAIRQFPNGQRVALYTDNKLNLTFTVPYDATGRGLSVGRVIPGMMAEEIDASDLPFEPNATRPKMPPGKHPADFRHVRNLARQAMKAGIAAQNAKTADDLVAQHNDLHQHIAEENVSVTFASGEELIVPKALLEQIDRVYSNLNEQNQAILNDMILENTEQFYRVVQFIESMKE